MKQILRRYALLLAGVFLWAGPLQAAEAPGKVVETYEEMPAGFTADGHPYLGKADAPVVLEEWSDYLCPFCGRHFRQTLPALKEKYVRSGQVKLVFRDMPIASLHPTASLGHLAARCVARQGSAAHYWTMHDALFSRQAEWNRLPDPSAFLAEVAEQAGADMAAYEACITSDETAKALEASVAAGQAHGFNGTPSFRLIEAASGNAYKLVGARPLDYFTPRLDALVAGEKPPEDPKPKPPELPSWAKPEGLAPDPERPGYTMAGDAYKGDADARLKVIEFTDLQCPSCRRHALETQPVLDRDFVETGKVQWVVKHFPLRIHPNAAVAAAAAECAADQERFWDMQHLMYERQGDWSTGDVDAVLVELATELELDIGAFETCLKGRQALERVLLDLYDGMGVVRSTPTFIIVQGETAAAIRGARSAEQFSQALEKLLERVTAGESGANEEQQQEEAAVKAPE